ncbi:MAG: hypothetical protein QOD73_1364 [Solirubrobacteraceae bacterium]|nr:hypothetical protein [Solirubrobacteraceae bacterium]
MTLIAAAVATALLMAPSAYHRAALYVSHWFGFGLVRRLER